MNNGQATQQRPLPAHIAEMSLAEKQEMARKLYRERLAGGDRLTGELLGSTFGMGERWGRDRIAEAHEEARIEAQAAPGTATKTRASRSKPAAKQPRAKSAGAATPEVAPGPSTKAATPDAAPQVVVGSEPSGRFVAWLGFGFGALLSIGGNILFCWLPAAPGQPPHPPGWTPEPAAMLFSAAWPLALLIAVEVMTRVSWPNTLLWNLARFGVVGAVGVLSAVISYGHLSTVLAAWHYDAYGAAAGPLVIDGLMTVSGFALLAISKSQASKGGTR
ncbi:hypothetical protein D5S17_14470 [Pseudonocardiaceae bacterium YIM PH 21723]|nr:hypothetical protein D5S17_14470 [Pseudonocardiaceae bacterium YIM PH 21723]